MRASSGKGTLLGALFAASFITPSITSLGSCAVNPVEAPPFVVSKPQCVIGDGGNRYRICGIEFEYFNTGDLPVESLEISCMVYDRETGENPFIGSNLVGAAFSETISPRSGVSLAVPLDPYLYVVPSAPFVIDFFHVVKIVYSDGSTWEDPQGFFSAGSE